MEQIQAFAVGKKVVVQTAPERCSDHKSPLSCGWGQEIMGLPLYTETEEVGSCGISGDLPSWRVVAVLESGAMGR